MQEGVAALLPAKVTLLSRSGGLNAHSNKAFSAFAKWN